MRLNREDESGCKALIAELGTLSLGAPDSISRIVGPFRELLGGELCMIHGFRLDGEQLRLNQFHIAMDRPRPRLQPQYDAWIAARGIDCTVYNPVRPAPAERNVPIQINAEIARQRLGYEHPIYEELMPQLGMAGFHHGRVLICEGASLLAWAGGIRSEPYTTRELEILRRLTPHLQRRLRLQRELLGTSKALLLDAVLESLAAPAFISNAAGVVEHANQLGLDAWSKEPLETRSALAAAIRSEHPGFEVRPLSAPGVTGRYLVIARSARPEERRVRIAAVRWSLTPRQAQVLALLARGLTNKAVAAELACSEKTVEDHVSAIFEKAQVGTRAALVARVHSVVA